jgi:hypothetical protein
MLPMPLTIAHPVAVLPLKRLGLPMSALIAGSMVPDLEHFIYLRPISYFSHSLPGLFLFCLPIGYLMLWIFYRLWVLALSPYITPSDWLAPPRFAPGKLGLGILTGALIHIAWDSFTHEYGFMVLRLPALSATVGEGHWYALPIFKILQHGSGLLGLGLMGLLAFYHRNQWPSVRPRVLVLLLAGLLLAGALALGSVLAQHGMPTAIRGLGKVVGTTVVRFAFISLLGMTAFSVFMRARTDTD